MQSKNDAEIKQRAYHIWEKEGRPEGRHHDHWHQAEKELTGSDKKKSGEKDPSATKQTSKISDKTLRAKSKK